jgi:hypothetical protein
MKQKYTNKLTDLDKSYLAGFLEGDGCILTQIVKDSRCKYGHTVRVSIIFYQPTRRHWFFLKLKKHLGEGWKIRKRSDCISELYVTGFTPVKLFLKTLHPYLRLKERLSRLVLEIIDEYNRIQTEADFLQVCLKIDKTAEYNDSKKRKHTYSSVKAYLNSPVETEKATSDS